MRIEKLTLQNFRLFENREFSFHPQFNLIIGENGSGKSSVLKALSISSGSLVSCLVVGSPIEGWLISDDDIFSKVAIYDNEQVSFEKIVPVCLTLLAKLDFYQHGLLDNNAINEYVYYGKDYLPKIESEKQYSRWPHFDDNWSSDMDFITPLIVFYGCNRLWLSTLNEKIHENAMTAKYSRRDGYKDWATAQADSTQLVEWLLKQNIIAFQEKKDPLGWRVLNIALKKCFEEFSHLSFMAKEGDLVVHFNDGHRQLFKHMSDGQRCMIGLIGDMVRRAVLLNPQLGDKILEETSGVVLIDELDLHLHPKWQRRIINDLKTTFPKVQFICTTHSPQLIGQAKADEIILLGADAEHPPQSYGMDSNWILRHIMGSDERDASVKEQLDDIFERIEDNQFDEAENEINALRERIGENSDLPDLQEAEALIARYSRFDDTENQ